MIVPESTEQTYDYGIFRSGSLVRVEPKDNYYYGVSEWRTAEDTLLGSSPVLEYTMPNENTTIVSKYTGVETILNVVPSDVSHGAAQNNTTTFLSGELVNVQAEAYTGYGFTGWYVLGEKVSGSDSFNYKVPKNESTIIAQFDKMYNFVATIKSDAGEITGTENGAYLPDTIINVSVSTTTGYDFLSWYVSDTLVGSSIDYSFAMPAKDITVEAKVATRYNYVAKSFNSGMGTITSADYGTFSVVSPASVSVGAKEGYVFDGWYNDKQLLSTDVSYTLKDQEGSQNITARFILSGMTCIVSDDKYVIETYTGSLANIIIPDMYNGHVIYGFSGTTFSQMQFEQIVFLSAEIFTYTSGEPFYKCTINSIIIPDGVTETPVNFLSNSKIASIELPASLEVIGMNTFYMCEIESIDLPITLKEIRKASFMKSHIKRIEIPSLVLIIGESAFESCAYLKSIELKSGLREIHARAFSICPLLTDGINVPESVTVLGDNVFQTLRWAEYVELHANIGDMVPIATFAQCVELKTVVLSANFITFGNVAFSDVQNELKVFSCKTDYYDVAALSIVFASFFPKIQAVFYTYSEERKAGAYWCRVNGVPTPWSEIE
jgi:uncharacterized repeat protein (TIGR02543 family)